MVSLSQGAGKQGDCVRARVETAITATVKQFNSSAVLPPAHLFEGKWLLKIAIGLFRQSCISCYFVCTFLPRNSKKNILIFHSQIWSFIHFVTGLETGALHWVEMSVANKLAKILSETSWRVVVSYLAHENFCEFIHGKLWVYLGTVALDTLWNSSTELSQKYQYSVTVVHIANWHGGWHEASRYWGFVYSLLRFQT